MAYINVLTDDKAIINRKSVLFNKKEKQVKKDNRLFDVAYGAFDRSEVCELIDDLLHPKLPEKYER